MTLFVGRIDRKAIPLAHQTELSRTIVPALSALYAEAARSGDDLAVLTTCERIEVYAAKRDSSHPFPNGSPFGGFDWLTSSGPDALRHLFRVAAGLESRLVGEPHILGQVRDALNHAREHGTAGRRIRDAFSAAIRSGRRVRGQTGLGNVAGGYAMRAVAFLARAIGPLGLRHVAVIGSGSLAADVAVGLRDAGVGSLTIFGRHERRVHDLATRVNARALSLDTVDDPSTAPVDFDAVVAATSSSVPIVTPATRDSWRTNLFIDLGGAPNVDPEIDSDAGTRVLRLEHLGGADGVSSVVDAANALVAEDVQRFLHRPRPEHGRRPMWAGARPEGYEGYRDGRA